MTVGETEEDMDVFSKVTDGLFVGRHLLTLLERQQDKRDS